MENIGKWIIFAGAFIILVGAVVWGAAKMGLPVGKLPGDFYFKGEKTAIYFPLVTGLVLSVVLTLIINLVLWAFKK